MNAVEAADAAIRAALAAEGDDAMSASWALDELERIATRVRDAAARARTAEALGLDGRGTDNPYIDNHAPRVRRERRRTMNALHKTHGNGAWRPYSRITPAMIALAATYLRHVFALDAAKCR